MTTLTIIIGCVVIPFIGGLIASRNEDASNYPIFERATENN